MVCSYNDQSTLEQYAGATLFRTLEVDEFNFLKGEGVGSKELGVCVRAFWVCCSET